MGRRAEMGGGGRGQDEHSSSLSASWNLLVSDSREYKCI